MLSVIERLEAADLANLALYCPPADALPQVQSAAKRSTEGLGTLANSLPKQALNHMLKHDAETCPKRVLNCLSRELFSARRSLRLTKHKMLITIC